jgi:transketolase
MAAAHHRVDSLVAIVDRNGLQQTGSGEEIMDLGDMAQKWRSFGWEAVEVDGHDVPSLYQVLDSAPGRGKPMAVIAHTVKGKGIPFCEGDNAWHHAVLSRSNYDEALASLAAEVDHG